VYGGKSGGRRRNDRLITYRMMPLDAVLVCPDPTCQPFPFISSRDHNDEDSHEEDRA